MRELRKSIIAPLFMKGYTYMAMRDIVREKISQTQNASSRAGGKIAERCRYCLRSK